MSIKNIVFDVGGVLADFRYNAYLDDIGMTNEEADLIRDKMIECDFWNEIDLSIRPMEDIIADVKRMMPHELEEKINIFFDKIVCIVRSFDYAKELTDYVKDNGLGLYILSNYADWLWEIHERDEFTFTKRVDGKIVSGIVHLVKPDPRIYQTLLNTYNLNANECVFFDDKPENIEAAKKEGMQGYVFTGYEDCRAIIDKIISGS